MAASGRTHKFAVLGSSALLMGAALLSGYLLAQKAQAQTQRGIDVSEWQGSSINWPAVAGSGVSFAYIRAGEGSQHLDADFQANWQGATAAGIAPGAYLYFHPAQDPVQQADLLVQQFRSAGLRGGDLIPAIDVETTDNQPAATVVANLQTTVNTVQRALGQAPAIYTSPVWWDNNIGSSAFTSDPLWVACWCGSTPTLPAGNWGGNGWAVWQYSDAGSVPGITGNVDLDQGPDAPLPYYHVPVAQVTALPANESSSTFGLSWRVVNGVPAASYTVWVQDGAGPWLSWAQTAQTSFPFTGEAGHAYSFYAQAVGTDGLTAGGPWGAQTSTTIAANAARTTPFGGLYGVDGTGSLHYGSSPPLAVSGSWPRADLVRGIATAPAGQGGYVLDAYGGVWPFGNAPGVTMSGYWRGWDIARGIALRPDGHSGYVLDGYGGVWPFGGAPGVSMSGYWRGWDIARGVVARPDGVGGYVLDGYGGVWPFGGASGVTFTGYWRGMNIARGLTMVPNSLTQGYVLDTDGGMWPFGGAPGVTMPNYGTSSTLRGISAG
jgi:lysozyme